MRAPLIIRRPFPRVVLPLAVALAAVWLGGNPAASASDAKDKAVLSKLDEPIAMDFKEAPLEDVLKYIKAATQGPNDDGIPIHVDPKRLEAAGATVHSKVTIKAQGIPLKTSLRDLLKPLGLTYRVEGGLLKIDAKKEKDKPKEQ